MAVHALDRSADERVNWITSIPFFLIHLLCLTALITGVTSKALILCAVLYFGRMWFITAGYHRYFSHRSYRTNRVFQFILAFGGATASQKGAAVVGGPPPRPPPLQRHRTGPALPAQGLLVEPRRLDPLRQEQRVERRRHQGLRQVPRAALPQQVRLDRAVDPRRRVAT